MSAKQAGKEVGKSTPTITRAIKSGRISATKGDSGGFEIEPAELFRVFPRVTPNGGNVKGEMLPIETPVETPMLPLESELRARLLEKDAVIEDLRRRLDEEASERRKLTNMLMEPRKRTFWSWLRRSA